MGSVNKVILVGNLGRDAELKFTPGRLSDLELQPRDHGPTQGQGQQLAGKNRVASHQAARQAG